MRLSVGMGMAIVVLFVGVTAISEAAQQSQSAVTTTPQQNAYDLGVEVFGGAAQAGIGIVWFGVAAIVLGALGLLVVSGRGGR